MNVQPAHASHTADLSADDMPAALEMHRLRRRFAQVGVLVVVVAALVVVVPGFADVREGLGGNRGRWGPRLSGCAAVGPALGAMAFIALKRSLRDEAAARIPCADDDVRAQEPAVTGP